MVIPELFAILVLVAIVTTAAAMPIYRRSLPDYLEQAALTVPPPAVTAAAPTTT